MSVITKVPEPNLWDVICREFASTKPPFREEDEVSVVTDYQDFDPAKHNPVFYGNMHHPVQTDMSPEQEIDVSKSHPSVVGYSFTDKPPESPKPPPPPLPDKKKCAPREYLETYVFPHLLPALIEMLRQAKKERCFERKRTKFDALDFLTGFLYRRNPLYTERGDIELEEIPFVKEWLKDHPRPPLPLSLIWTEEEAALIIQSFWRGYCVRKETEVQELRQWQREWREENRGIQDKITNFWEKKMPGGGDEEDPAQTQDGGQSQESKDNVNTNNDITEGEVNIKPPSPMAVADDQYVYEGENVGVTKD